MFFKSNIILTHLTPQLTLMPNSDPNDHGMDIPFKQKLYVIVTNSFIIYFFINKSLGKFDVEHLTKIKAQSMGSNSTYKRLMKSPTNYC